MAKILVTHSYFYYFDQKQWKSRKPYPPLGSLYASAVLRNGRHEVVFFDNALQKSTAPFKSFLSDQKPDFLLICDDGFNYLTKMCLTNMREAAIEMSAWAMKNGVRTVISSSDSTDHFELYLRGGADVIVLGENEVTIHELFQNLPWEENLHTMKGIAYKKAGNCVSNGKREVVRNLDSLPLPAWDLADIGKYRKVWMRNHGYFSLNISTTRGCPYKCNWCAKPIYGNRYNSRSPAKVVEEMALLQDRYGVEEFWITDDIFGLKPGWVQSFADEVSRAGRKFRYKIQSRADLLLRSDDLEAMIMSGLEEVWIGAVSGSQKILDAMDKGTTVGQIRLAAARVREFGKKVCFFIQFGYPGENEEDIRMTIDLILELMPDDIGISISYPLPGTKFYEMVKAGLKEKTNWRHSDDLDALYEGSRNRSYYHSLHRLVHKLYRRKKGLEYILNPPGNRSFYSPSQIRSIILSLLYYGPAIYYSRMHNRRLQKLA